MGAEDLVDEPLKYYRVSKHWLARKERFLAKQKKKKK